MHVALFILDYHLNHKDFRIVGVSFMTRNQINEALGFFEYMDYNALLKKLLLVLI